MMTKTATDLVPSTTDDLDGAIPLALRDDDNNNTLPQIQLDASAVVEWVDDDGHTQSLSYSDPPNLNVKCLVHLDPSSFTAFFRLRIPLLFERPKNTLRTTGGDTVKNTASNTRKKKGTDVFVFIPPEHILELTRDNSIPVEKAKLNDEVLCLRFMLNMPPKLIVPNADVVPRGNSKRLLATLRSLAQQTTLALYIPRSDLAEDRCLSLCRAASNKSLTSIPRIADITNLYGGKGGKVLEVTQVDIPPSYDEVEPRPPFPPNTNKTLKRSRHSSPLESLHQDDAACRKRVASLEAVVGALSKTIEVQGEEIKKLYQQLSKEAGARKHMMEGLEIQTRVLREELDDMEVRVMRRIDWRIQRQPGQ